MQITVWRLQSAKVPTYACPVVCLYRCCNEIENLYTDFESCISVIADSRNYDYEINGYIWIVTLLLWFFFRHDFQFTLLLAKSHICMSTGVCYWIVQVVVHYPQSVLPVWFNGCLGTTFRLRTCWTWWFCWISRYKKKTEKCLLYIIKKYLT